MQAVGWEESGSSCLKNASGRVRGFRILLSPECKRQCERLPDFLVYKMQARLGERVPDPLVSRMQAVGWEDSGSSCLQNASGSVRGFRIFLSTKCKRGWVRGFRIFLSPECKRQGERVPDPLVFTECKKLAVRDSDPLVSTECKKLGVRDPDPEPNAEG